MRVEIWADVVCAWAYIGKRRLERTLADWSGEDVDVVWRPFRIDPTAPAAAVPLAQALRDPVVAGALSRCVPDASPAVGRERAAQVAAEVGLGSPWGAAWRVDPTDAHRLIALAYDHGGSSLQDAVVEAVLQAHFVEAADISDRAVLGALAVASGFPAGAGLLAGDAGRDAVRDLLLEGRARGVTTSPTILVGERAMAGAQLPQVIAEFLRRAGRAAEPARETPAEVRRYRHAESLLELRDPLGALTLLGPLLAEHGDDRGVRLLAARACYASAQLGRARHLLEALVDETPDDPYVHRLLGRTLQRQSAGGPEGAAHLRLAAALAPSSTMVP